MPSDQTKRKRIYRKLRNKYRLVIMNDETLEEKSSLRLSPLNVFVFSGTVIIGLIVMTIYLVAFTPLREYIPGYTDLTMRRKLISLTMQSDSMQTLLAAQAAYLRNLRDVIDGKAGQDSSDTYRSGAMRYDTIQHLTRSRDDSLLRAEVEAQDQYSLVAATPSATVPAISSFYFFTPLKGTLTSEFDPRAKHYGVDIVSGPNEPIKATLDGTVLIADWTTETGYVIGIQHTNNLFSMYKHNSALLKKPGDFVQAGEVIAIIGNTGEFTTDPTFISSCGTTARRSTPSITSPFDIFSP